MRVTFFMTVFEKICINIYSLLMILIMVFFFLVIVRKSSVCIINIRSLPTMIISLLFTVVCLMCVDDYESGLNHIFFFEIHEILCLTHELDSVLTTQQQTQSDSFEKVVTNYYSIIRDAK